MFHLKTDSISQLTILKSQFICLLHPISNEKDIKSFINEAKKTYPNATHYCYGAIINSSNRSNDDGEPASSAGKPILEALINYDLDNTIAVVVRYYGGSPLGKARLAKTYKQVTAQAIEQATFTVPTLFYHYQIIIDYSYVNRLEQLLQTKALNITRDNLKQAQYDFYYPEDLTSQVSLISNGSAIITKLEETYFEI